jgi:hypothetical protein
MSKLDKVLKSAAGNAAGDAPNVADVFSTYLYEGTGSAQTITNGIDLDGEGGMVWIKNRDSAQHNILHDTNRGVGKRLISNGTYSEGYDSEYITSFNSGGFSIGTYYTINTSGDNYTSWTFRKAPRFFDVVTYTGDGNAVQYVNHDLGVAPGMVIVKALATQNDNDANQWWVGHRSISTTGLLLNSSAGSNGAERVGSNSVNIQPKGDSTFNINGASYVAYLFAHDPDGENDDGMIACGSYTGTNNTTHPIVDLGWEPQYIMIKRTNGTGNWYVWDSMRGLTADGSFDTEIYPSSSGGEYAGREAINITSTGFEVNSTNTANNGSGNTYIYMAIRAPMMKEPESGSEVFAVDNGNGSDIPAWTSGFPVDMVFWSDTTGDNHKIASRLTGARVLETDTTGVEVAQGSHEFDYSDGFYSATRSSVQYAHMFKRAKGFFDVVAYTGNSTAGHTVNHSLGVAPEMMWIKTRSGSNNWAAISVTMGLAYRLESDVKFYSSMYDIWTNSTAPTTNVITLGSEGTVNYSGTTYIAYLFASLDGVSKVGSYTGNGSNQNIACGFSAGARFVLIKRTDSTGDWYIWDTERGIVSGNDPHLSLNSTAAEVTSDDSIDPESSGFTVNQVSATNINESSATYIFLAIA